MLPFKAAVIESAPKNLILSDRDLRKEHVNPAPSPRSIARLVYRVVLDPSCFLSSSPSHKCVLKLF